MTITQEQVDRIKATLSSCAFTLESLAHLQGREKEILPIAKDARKLVIELTPVKERKHCTECGRSLDFQGYCIKCDGDIYED